MMTIQLVWAMGVVQFGEEQGLAVIGPGHAAVAIFERQFAHHAAGEFFHIQAVDLVATGVQAIGQALVVGADIERAQRQEAAGSQFIGVEQQLLLAFVDRGGVVGRAGAAVVARVLIAGGGAGVIQVGPPGRGQRQIGLADACADFFEQLFAQLRLVGQLRLLVEVFGLEVIEHLFLVTHLQPGIRVGAGCQAGNRGAWGVDG
ncbi:hypothetical protein D9M71_293660 [compost metagenome]